jgi:outer membrane protein OmpA-like peptidoglycan-associated protein
LVTFLFVAALPSDARAEPLRLSLKLDPSVAFPLTRPQRDAFGVGGGGFLKGAYGPLDWLDLQVSVGGLAFAPKNGGGIAGVFGVGGGIRFQLPQRRFRVTPFVEGDALYTRTGDLNRFAFAVGAGMLIAVDRPRRFWLGLHVRYLQVVQGSESGFDTTDADILMLGISTQIGFARRANASPDSDGDGIVDERDRCPKERGPAENEGCPTIGRATDSDGDGVVDSDDACPDVKGSPELHGCGDHDNDGVADPDDKCPEKAGPPSNGGCPTYKAIVLTDRSIDLNQKIFFAHDLADILPKSFEILDEVAQALRDHKGLRVRIEGHTDSQGRFSHNLDLSLARARSVMQYLVDHGVPAKQLSAMGYGSTQPLTSNRTADGRERNRRVEFVIDHDGEAK